MLRIFEMKVKKKKVFSTLFFKLLQLPRNSLLREKKIIHIYLYRINPIEKSLDKTRFCECCCCLNSSTCSRMLNKMFNSSSSSNNKIDSIHFFIKTEKSFSSSSYFFSSRARERKSCIGGVYTHKFYSKCVLSIILKLFVFSGSTEKV